MNFSCSHFEKNQNKKQTKKKKKKHWTIQALEHCRDCQKSKASQFDMLIRLEWFDDLILKFGSSFCTRPWPPGHTKLRMQSIGLISPTLFPPPPPRWGSVYRPTLCCVSDNHSDNGVSGVWHCGGGGGGVPVAGVTYVARKCDDLFSGPRWGCRPAACVSYMYHILYKKQVSDKIQQVFPCIILRLVLELESAWSNSNDLH